MGAKGANKGKVGLFIDMRRKVKTTKFQKVFDNNSGRVIPTEE